jgi:hypothetical protein
MPPTNGKTSKENTMPTGYTAELMENGQDFEDFTLNCARAMGACVMLRDEASGKAPRRIENGSSYHLKGLEKAKVDLKEFKNISKVEKEIKAKKEIDANIKRYEKAIEKEKKENARLDAMAVQVNAWNPPTNEHQGLKDFMLQQIEVSSSDSSFYTDEIKKEKKKNVKEVVANILEGLEHSIEYHQKHLVEDTERDDGRNQWLEDLYTSLGL